MNRKATIAAAFGRAAPTYDAHAAVQRTAAGLLAARIDALGLPPAPRVLEVGCGTGLLTAHLAATGAGGLVTDLSPAMVAAARARVGGGFAYAVMDGEAPAAGPGFDLICANLAVQWFEQPEASLRGWARLLRPGGWIAFSTVGPGSLACWRAAIAAEGSPVPAFWDPDGLAGWWQGDVRIDHATLPVTYRSAGAFLAALRGIGAGTPQAGYRPLTPGQLRRAMRRFEDAGTIAEYDVVFACLRAG